MLSRYSPMQRWGLRFIYAPMALFVLLVVFGGAELLDRYWPWLLGSLLYGLGIWTGTDRS